MPTKEASRPASSIDHLRIAAYHGKDEIRLEVLTEFEDHLERRLPIHPWSFVCKGQFALVHDRLDQHLESISELAKCRHRCNIEGRRA